MTFIITSRTRAVGNRAPTGLLRLNPAKTRGVVFAYAGGENRERDLITGESGTFSGDISTVPTPHSRIGYYFEDTTNNDIAYSNLAPTLSGSNYSLTMWGRLDAVDSSGSIPFSGPTGRWFQIGKNKIWISNKDIVSVGIEDEVIAAGYSHIAFVSRGGTIEFYLNGALEVSATQTPNAYSAGGKAMQMGGYVSSTAYDWNGVIGELQLWDYGLTSAEVWALYNPQTRWDIYAQPSRTYFIPAAAGGVTTSNVPASDITITPQPPNALRSLITNIPAV